MGFVQHDKDDGDINGDRIHRHIRLCQITATRPPTSEGSRTAHQGADRPIAKRQNQLRQLRPGCIHLQSGVLLGSFLACRDAASGRCLLGSGRRLNEKPGREAGLIGNIFQVRQCTE
jgi:hypothetical protein